MSRYNAALPTARSGSARNRPRTSLDQLAPLFPYDHAAIIRITLWRIDENSFRVFPHTLTEVIDKALQAGHLLDSIRPQFLKWLAGAAGDPFIRGRIGEQRRLYGLAASVKYRDHLPVVILELDVLTADRLCAIDKSGFLIRYGLGESTTSLGHVLMTYWRAGTTAYYGEREDAYCVLRTQRCVQRVPDCHMLIARTIRWFGRDCNLI